MKRQVTRSLSQAEFHAEVMKRARAVLGLRGIKNVKYISLNLTRLNYYAPLAHVVISEDQMVALVRAVVSDTLAHL